jgi:hypothetical protein
MNHLRSAREFMRVLISLHETGHSRAAAFLASALRVHGLARRWTHRGPFVVLAPDDAAFESAGFSRVPGDGMTIREARAILEAHVAIRPPVSSPSKLEVTTLAGQTVRVDDLESAWPCGSNLVLPVRDLLLPSAAKRPQFTEARRAPAATHLPV